MMGWRHAEPTAASADTEPQTPTSTGAAGALRKKQASEEQSLGNGEPGSCSPRIWGEVYHSAPNTVLGPKEQVTVSEKDKATKRRNCREREGVIPVRTKSWG